MSRYPAIPHLRLPLDFSGGRAGAVEQDTPDDVAQCVETVLLYEPGHLEANPRFGVEDQAFALGGPDAGELIAAAERFEPRARLLLDEAPQVAAQLEATVRLRLAQRDA